MRTEITEDDIERAAEAAAVASGFVSTGVWGALPEFTQGFWRRVTRAALEAIPTLEVLP